MSEKIPYVDLWGWFHNFLWQARRTGDQDRVQLVQLFYETSRHRETEPERCITTHQQAADLARRLNEPWMAIFHDYWRCEMYVFYLGDLITGLDLAVRLVVEARKPVYTGCPVLGRVYRILVDAYTIIDPVGYADRIGETIDHMIAHIPMDDDTHQLLTLRRADLAVAHGRYAEAEAVTQAYIALCNTSFRLADGYSMLCQLAHRRGDDVTALACARVSEEHAHRSSRRALHAQALAWQALFLRKAGNEDEARAFFRKAVNVMAPLRRLAGDDYYDALYRALCDFHEIGGEPEKSLKLRDQQLTELSGSGEHHALCLCYLARLRLKGRLGLPLDAEFRAAETAAANLLQPDWYHAALGAIRSGEYNDQ